MPPEARPSQLLGCEVWRGLDWLPDRLKVVQSLDAHSGLATALNAAFDSQIGGGKRYDLAVEGRRLASATFFDSHAQDGARQVAHAMDLSPLIGLGTTGVARFSEEILEQFKGEVLSLLRL